MRLGHFLLVLAWIGTAAFGASRPPVELAARARHLFEDGVTLEQLGQHQQAIDALTQAIDTHALKNEDAARAVFDRGVAYDAMNDTRRAIADYSAALRLESHLAAALSNRANAFRRIGKLDEAKRDYFAALACPGVENQYPYYGLGLIAEKLGDVETARDYFQKALAVAPSFALAAQSLSAVRRPAHVSQSPAPVRQPANPAISPPPSKPLASSNGPSDHPVLRHAINDTSDHRGSAVQVQLGAYRDEHMAAAAWERIAVRAGGALEGLKPIVVTADLPGKGRFWRLRTAVSDAKSAKKLCASLSSTGQACLIARD